MFAGTNFSSGDYRRTMAEMRKRETVLCVVSKSGNTLEVKAGFDILRSLMRKSTEKRLQGG